MCSSDAVRFEFPEACFQLTVNKACSIYTQLLCLDVFTKHISYIYQHTYFFSSLICHLQSQCLLPRRPLFSSSAPLVSLFYHRAPPFCAHVTIGYVGGTFLSRLLTTPSIVDKLDLTLYVRSPEKARSLESEFGVKTVVGTLADVDKLENASEQAHLVISIVSAAILETSWCKF